MSSQEIHVEVEVVCNVHQNEKLQTYTEDSTQFNLRLLVEPCNKCLATLATEAEESEEQFDTEVTLIFNESNLTSKTVSF